jgi:hypothetical protein
MALLNAFIIIDLGPPPFAAIGEGATAEGALGEGELESLSLAPQDLQNVASSALLVPQLGQYNAASAVTGAI